MILATKVRLLPTPEQEKQMFKSAGTRRFIYKCTLAKQAVKDDCNAYKSFLKAYQKNLNLKAERNQKHLFIMII